jgi:phosphoenolpyruvate carboxykinase (GTP)
MYKVSVKRIYHNRSNQRRARRNQDLDLTGLKISKQDLKQAFSVHKNDWQQELADIKEFFTGFGKDLPKEMWQELHALQKRLG